MDEKSGSFQLHKSRQPRDLFIFLQLSSPFTPPNASMTDLTAVLPDFPTDQYVRLLPNLEKNRITVADLLTLDCIEVAKRAQVPLLDVKRLQVAVLAALQVSLGVKDPENGLPLNALSLKRNGSDVLNLWNKISTLDDDLDRALGGGIPAGYITEITGER